MRDVAHSAPILVGCGDITDTRTAPGAARSSFELMTEAGRRALADTGRYRSTAQAIDTVAVPGSARIRRVSKVRSISGPKRPVPRHRGERP